MNLKSPESCPNGTGVVGARCPSHHWLRKSLLRVLSICWILCEKIAINTNHKVWYNCTKSERMLEEDSKHQGD